MRILYVTPEISWPLSFGGAIRKWNVLQGLLKAGQTDVLVFRRGDTAALAQESYVGCERIFELDAKHLQPGARRQRLYASTLGRGILALTSVLPFEYQGQAFAALRSQTRKQIDSNHYDLVWFATARTAIPIGRIESSPTILDGDDFSYIREWHLLRAAPWYGAKIWNYLDVIKLWYWERGYAQRFTRVLRCSQEDSDRHPSPNVTVLPNGTDVPQNVERAPQKRILFVGDLGYAPNQQGMEWFLEHVWPLVRQQVPDAALDIGGRKPSALIEQRHGKAGVVVHGFVPQLAPLYRTAGLSIVPLHAGGGTRLKILESLAYEVPVVSTQLGAFGLEMDARHGVEHANSPADFAARCIEILQNLDQTRSRASAGRELVRLKYDWRVIQERVVQLVDQTAGGPREARS
jgi:glycosyltransferase involved in cell wall biosynthesis